MRLTFLLLADYAALLADNKFLIAGEFDKIAGLKAPLTHPTMYVVGRIESDATDTIPHDMLLSIVDGTGAQVRELKLGEAVRFGPTPYPNTVRIQFLLKLDNLNLPEFGAYAFQVLVDRQVVGSTAFYVEKVTPAEAAARMIQIRNTH
jgi:uncharacterized protein DUF6941